MRVTADRSELAVAPGESASLVVNVFNNHQVIDGVSARVIGLPEDAVRCEPALLPLFPDATGQLTVTVAAPRHLVAGRHPIAIEISSHGAQAPTQYLEIVLVVAASPQLQITGRPRRVKSRRTGRFVLEVTNPGNVRLQVDLQASDPNRSMAYRFAPQQLTVQPGRSLAAVLHVRAPRKFTGGEMGRGVTVVATGERMDLPPDWIDPDAEPLTDTTDLELSQRPLISRGLLTACILASIVALWAGAFLFGLAKVFASNPPTKQAPASFFWLKGVTRVGTANAAFDLNRSTIPGTLPKVGELPPGEGSQITGTVVGWVDNQPVGRILVEAYRLKNNTTPYPVSSAGTQTDGTFALAGLFPTSYYLKFSASGYRSVWYSGSPNGSSTLRGAALIQTRTQGAVSLPNLVIHGQPATIRGGVNPGDTTSPVDVTVTANLMIGDVPQASKKTTVHTDPATNKYVLSGLPAPASYELTFTAAGYQTSAIVETVGGGDDRFEPPIALSAGQGQISGRVTDAAGTPLGNVTVSTVVNGAPVTVTTPTVGALGVYNLQNLPTPGTYVVTFSNPNYGTKTSIVNLGVGANASKPLNAKLIAGTGSVNGKVVGPGGSGLGGVTITVGGTSVTGAGATPSTTTLTDGGRGNFAVNGLVAPGSYTLTAQLSGYLPTTVAFDLNGTTALKSITIILSQNTGSITGQVFAVDAHGHPSTCPEKSCANATVTATNGQQTWTVGVSSAGGSLPHGGYLFTDLAPGVYTLVVSDAGMLQKTAIVTVTNRTTPTQQPLTLTRAG